MKLREIDIAAPIVAYLKDLRWEVYQEVVLRGAVADIVAVQCGIVWIVETKVAGSLALLYQARRWLRSSYASMVSVGVPRSKYEFGEVCRDLGVGILHAGPRDYGSPFCDEYVQPRYVRLKTCPTLALLHEAQKTECAAGASGGGHYTPFKQTCKNLREFLAINGPATIEECIKNTSHHWRTPSSARQCLASWARRNVLIGVRIVAENPIKLGLTDSQYESGARAS